MMRLEISPEQIEWQRHPIGGHAVLAVTDAERDDVFVATLIAHHTDGFDRQEHGEGLPDFLVVAGGL